MRQSPKQTVKGYVAVGRDYLLRLRDGGVEGPGALLIPCFKAGIEARLKNHALPLLNLGEFDTELEAMAQQFQRITVGLQGASNGGYAHTTHGSSVDERTVWFQEEAVGRAASMLRLWRSRSCR
jgi:hypothetical protein